MPDASALASALAEATTARPTLAVARGHFVHAHAPTLPALGVILLPKCPVCWAAYASVFGAAGLGRIPYTPWLLPAMAALLAFAVVSVAVGSWRRGRPGPAILALGAGALVLAGQFALSTTPPMWVALALLFASAAWSSLRRHPHAAPESTRGRPRPLDPPPTRPARPPSRRWPTRL